MASQHQKVVCSSWGYDKENGPTTWAQAFPAALGARQSPVDIDTKNVQHDSNLAKNPLTINYQKEPSLHLENPGYSFKAHITAHSTITGGPLGKDVYKLEQFHFHWGKDDKCGSEHTVDGKTYACELHLVHFNSTKYKSFADAVTQSDGLAVIGVLIKVGSRDHEGFKLLSSNAHKIKSKGSKCDTGVSLNPAALLPEDVSKYWTYEGSLTTPPCHESVTWIVLKQELTVSCDQIRAMRNICSDECGSKPIPDNYRPPLPLGNRKIFSSTSD